MTDENAGQKHSQWDTYRKLRRRFVAAVLLVAAGQLIASSLIEERDWPRRMDKLWIFAAMPGIFWHVYWKCPYCWRPFFSRIYSYNPFAKHCVHCDLEKWSDPVDLKSSTS